MILKKSSELLQIANNYEIEASDVFQALKESLENILKCGKLYTDLSNGKIEFYELIYNRFGEKRRKIVKIKQSNYKAISDRFMDIVTQLSIKKRKAHFKKIKKEIVKGKIIKITKSGYEIATKVGYGFCSKLDVLYKDVQRIKIGDELYFSIKKYRNYNNGSLIFTRKNLDILKKEIQENMSDCGVYYIEKISSRKVSIFCTKMPSKEQLRNTMRVANTFLDIQVRN